MTNEEMIKDLWKDVRGNGRGEGLVTRMTRVEEKMDAQMRKDASLRREFRWYFALVILLALMAGRHPLAERVIEKFTGIDKQTSAQSAP